MNEIRKTTATLFMMVILASVPLNIAMVSTQEADAIFKEEGVNQRGLVWSIIICVIMILYMFWKGIRSAQELEP